MAGARLELAFTVQADANGLRIPSLGENRLSVGERGAEEAELLFAANPGEDLRPLARIASGGELSRLLLAVRSILRAPEGPRCLAFDEVDQGIGGRAAEAVARRLLAVSHDAQVLAITHLPVLAAYADHHLAIEKVVQEGRTHVTVTALHEEARVEEIARMMGGGMAPREAIEHARSLRAEARRAGGANHGASSRGTPRQERTAGGRARQSGTHSHTGAPARPSALRGGR
jgi:DNA repair protein RecN (Recombination protein N)